MNIKIGTRSSALALWQANHVAQLLQKQYPDCTVELVEMSTRGDRILDKPLASIGGKGLFTEELEKAMLDGSIDMAVHSLKDMPTDLPEGLILGAFTKREEPWDVLVSPKYKTVENLPKGAIVGSSSLRRQAQLLRMRPDLQIKPLRGNVNTRLQKLLDGEYDAIVLAYAGLHRLGLGEYITEVFDVDTMIPAVGQGALAIECVKGSPMEELLKPLQDKETTAAVEAERSFLRHCHGSCQVPIGVFAKCEKENLKIHGLISDLQGENVYEGVLSVPMHEAEKGGITLAEQLFSDGAMAIIEELSQEGILR